MRYTLFIAVAVCLAGVIAFAQDPVLPAANIEALFKDSNAKLNENKQVAYHIERDLLQCKRWNRGDRWLTERYIQHNPADSIWQGRNRTTLWQSSRPRDLQP